MEWLPIETSPIKTPILITDGNIVTVAILDECGDHPKWMYGYGFSGWEWDYDFSYEEATHWMLLPPLPSSQC